MAENVRTTPLRIRPGEYRSLLVLGDLLMAVISVLPLKGDAFGIAAE